jgi:hypothetical protein
MRKEKRNERNREEKREKWRGSREKPHFTRGKRRFSDLKGSRALPVRSSCEGSLGRR